MKKIFLVKNINFIYEILIVLLFLISKDRAHYNNWILISLRIYSIKPNNSIKILTKHY